MKVRREVGEARVGAPDIVEGDADRRMFFKGNVEHDYLYVGGNGRLTRRGYKAGAVREGRTLNCDHSMAGAASGGNGGLKGNNKETGMKRASLIILLDHPPSLPYYHSGDRIERSLIETANGGGRGGGGGSDGGDVDDVFLTLEPPLHAAATCVLQQETEHE
ncbi:hypothetical protein Cgig2_033869 [Carnegiea gigantea]|uniref:Uncharacterized protein n=1 Tax=Carnegiea gigantea TaxID=171969 RepID=A0A9Q1JXQ1_9CARY|nr:hypothetical protein Cgig2_033869 [Carnegiea gigantea]